MGVKTVAAVVTIVGALGASVSVGVLAGAWWGLLAGSLLVMSAGIWNLTQE